MRLPHAIKSLRLFHRLPALAHGNRSLPRRSLIVVLSLALLLSGGFAAVNARAAFANAGGQRNEHAQMDYLALGNSVAFGYSPLLEHSNANNFIGYPTPVADALDLKLTNTACPGATSGYFVSLSLPDWECIPYRSVYPLHVSYDTSQLDYAVAYLRAHPRTRLVTIDIGANDLLKLQHDCLGDPTCIQRDLPATLANVAVNLNTIYGAIRHEAHYHGQLVALTYYSSDYRNALITNSLYALNQVVAARTRAWGGAVADGFDTFANIAAAYGGDTCAAGLLIRTGPSSCDIHPSAEGREILADAILAVVKHNADRSVAA